MLRVEKNIEVIGDIELAKITITAGSGLVLGWHFCQSGLTGYCQKVIINILMFLYFGNVR